MASNYFRIKKGLSLDNTQASAVSAKGDIAYNTSTDKVEIYNGSVDPVVTEAKASTLTNKTISGSSNTISSVAYSSLVLSNSIVNADINASAAIAYAKLNLASSIVNADINASAAIAYSKLALTGSVVNADINASAAIAYSKLNLSGSILNADINTSAAIAYSKLNLTGNIVNADINSSAAIAWSKLATGTISQIVVTNGSGVLTTSSNIGISNGGTGQTTQQAALNALAPAAPSTGQVIQYDGANWVAKSPAAGTKNYLTALVTSNGTNTGNGNFEFGNTTGWSLVNTVLSSSIPTTVSNAGAALATAQYIFTVTSANATVGATFTNNSKTFTVVNTIASKTLLVCTGTGSPTASGTLTKATGTGDATITFSAFVLTTASGNLALSAVSSSQISGSYSGSLASSAASTAGDSLITSAFFVDTGDQAKVMQVTFAYEAISGTFNFSGSSSNTHAIWIYDVTNAAWIMPAGVYNLVQSSGVGKATATFQTTSNSTQYQLALVNINATSGAYTLYVDDFFVGPQITLTAPAMSDWASDANFTTSSITGQGTITNMVARSRRSGPDLMVHLTYTSGTTAGTAWTVVLPSIYTINSAAFGTVSQKVGEIKMLETASTQYPSVGEGPWAIFYDGSTTNTLYIAGHTSSNVYTKDNGNQGNSSIPNDVWFTIPVSGWSSNSVASSDTDTRVIAAKYYIGTATFSATNGNQINFDSKDYDTAGAVTTGASWKFTAPITGIYDVGLTINTAAATATDWWLYKNGAKYQYIILTSASGTTNSFTGVSCNSGDTLDIRGDSSINLNGSTSTPWLTSVTIARKSGPAVITATESVNARYFSSSSSISGSLATVTYATKDFDSHNAYSGGTYTIPVSGKYEVNAAILITGTVALNNNLIVEVQKNGTVVSRFTEFFAATLTDGKASFSDLVNCLAGDTIRIQVSSSVTGPSIVSSNFDNYFSIFRQGN